MIEELKERKLMRVIEDFAEGRGEKHDVLAELLQHKTWNLASAKYFLKQLDELRKPLLEMTIKAVVNHLGNGDPKLAEQVLQKIKENRTSTHQTHIEDMERLIRWSRQGKNLADSEIPTKRIATILKAIYSPELYTIEYFENIASFLRRVHSTGNKPRQRGPSYITAETLLNTYFVPNNQITTHREVRETIYAMQDLLKLFKKYREGQVKALDINAINEKARILREKKDLAVRVALQHRLKEIEMLKAQVSKNR